MFQFSSLDCYLYRVVQEAFVQKAVKGALQPCLFFCFGNLSSGALVSLFMETFVWFKFLKYI